MKQKKIAIIDIGSNSVRMVIFENNKTIFNERVFCGLGRDLNKTKKLNKAAQKKAILTLKAFTFLSQAKEVQKIITVGTAALREAVDSKKFIDKVYAETKQKIRIISGKKEAQYAAQGVLAYDKNAQGMVADFGGGSLELALVENKKIQKCESHKIGAFRLLNFKSKAFEKAFESLNKDSKLHSKEKKLYVIGGAWRALIGFYYQASGQQFLVSQLQGQKVSAKNLIVFCKKIEKMKPIDIQKKFKCEKHRAELCSVSAQVLRATVEKYKIETIIASIAGIRDGILIETMQKLKHGK